MMIGVIELEDRMSRFVTFKMIHHYGTVRDAYKYACAIGYEKHRNVFVRSVDHSPYLVH